MRKSLGRHFNGIRISSSEAFVLELVLDNLGKTPTFATKVMRDVAARLKELSLRDYDGTLDCVKSPLMKSIDIRYQDTLTVKQDLGSSGGDSQQSQPIHENKCFYSHNLVQSREANLINLRENSHEESKIMTDKTLEPIYSSIEAESSKLSKKERKRLKKEEAKKLAKTLEPLPQVKEEKEDQTEEVLVKTEDLSVEPFPQLSRPSDSSVASFPDISKSKTEWL